MSNIRLNKDMIGKKVRCIDKLDCYYPKPGTIGTIVKYDNNDVTHSYKVQWPKGSTKGDDEWWVFNNYIELIEDDMMNEQKNPKMTNEEIWEMLRPKMEKNNLKSTVSITYVPTLWDGKDLIESKKAYYEDDVHNAIALAYKVGYLRAMKGRPFKFGEKRKKGGHWEPVDPNNLPKEGARVKYARKCKDYTDDIIMIGDTGVVAFEGVFTPMWFGMKLDNPRKNFFEWVDFSTDENANCLDMWVEDDE